MKKIFKKIEKESNRAIKLHGAFNSIHEAYAVLLEEVDEFWEEVRKKNKNRCKKKMQEELIQIAVVAIKTIESFCEN